MKRIVNRDLVVAAGIVTVIILYGSLYPFAFHQQGYRIGPLQTLIATARLPPRPADFLANILLYVPLGFFSFLAMRAEIGFKWRLLVTLIIGGLLSTTIELAQYYAPRVTAATDIYANATGSTVGALAGAIFGTRLRWPFSRHVDTWPFPTLILVAWISYSLFPFVPAIDLHKYWDALKPLFLQPRLHVHDVIRYSVSWLVVCALLEAVFDKNRSLRLLPILVTFILLAKIMIIGKVLSWAEITGAIAGYCFWLVLVNRPYRVRAIIMASLVGIYVVTWRLAPFQFADRGREFSWIPFLSFMAGSPLISVASFLEKTFHYGALLWLVTITGVRLRMATASVSILLLTTSIAQVYLPGRSAEITDTFMTLIIAMIFALLRHLETRPPSKTSFTTLLNPHNLGARRPIKKVPE